MAIAPIASGYRAFSANTTDPQDFIDLQNPILSAAMMAVSEALHVEEWLSKWDDDPDTSFTKAQYIKMLQKCIMRIQGDNCSRARAIGHKAQQKEREDWGGHCIGGHKFKDPSIDDCWEVSADDLDRNSTLGSIS